ncbi:MAG: hypothetical protein AM325_008510 [Candidatus Thorarchaeota archaeon SMTZ1-45]|nr:MAG: hypothetical protein AM325_10225 [Candidatus Thorarchaeota archaeon SMTZ1-45]
MSNSENQSNFLKDLEHTEIVLQDLLATLSSLNSALKPIESRMKLSDFASSGEYVQGSSKGIVCVLSGLIRGDPLEKILTEKGRGKDIPTLIKAGDRSESQATVESIVNILHAEDKKRSLEYIINLRWAEFPSLLEDGMVVIRGTRYVGGSPLRLTKLEANLGKLGLRVLKDSGEFGGGPLSYRIAKSFINRHNLLIAELTLSRQVIESDNVVIKILNMLAAF